MIIKYNNTDDNIISPGESFIFLLVVDFNKQGRNYNEYLVEHKFSSFLFYFVLVLNI